MQNGGVMIVLLSLETCGGKSVCCDTGHPSDGQSAVFTSHNLRYGYSTVVKTNKTC